MACNEILHIFIVFHNQDARTFFLFFFIHVRHHFYVVRHIGTAACLDRFRFSMWGHLVDDGNVQYETIHLHIVIHSQFAVVQLCQRACQSQSDACSLHDVLPIPIPHERPEYFFTHVQRYNLSIVACRYPEMLFLLVHRQLETGKSLPVFQGIGQQITDNLGQGLLIYRGPDLLFRHLASQVHPSLLGQGSEAFAGKLHQPAQVTFLGIQLKAFVLGLAEVEQLVHQVQQALGVLVHDFQFHLHFVGQYIVFQDAFQRTLYQGKWRSDFVCHVGKEVYLGHIKLSFFLLLEFLHLIPVLGQGTPPEVGNEAKQ